MSQQEVINEAMSILFYSVFRFILRVLSLYLQFSSLIKLAFLRLCNRSLESLKLTLEPFNLGRAEEKAHENLSTKLRSEILENQRHIYPDMDAFPMCDCHIVAVPEFHSFVSHFIYQAPSIQ